MSAAKPRAVLYLRQSVSREDSISLELQETACRNYATAQGYTVVAVESDPGISGRTWKRPGVLKVMNLIDAKQAEVIVLWKWSRLSRSRLDWAVAADRVQTAGGRIESATEAIDVSTSTGRLARGMLTEFAAFESERIGDVWKETHARRVSQGRPANGKPRFGYTYTREGGFIPDDITGPILRQMYLRYIAGSSFPSLVNWLNSGPARPVSGYTKHVVDAERLWGIGTVKSVLDSGFGAGYFTARGTQHTGVHEPVITEEEWQEYLTRREQRAVKWPTGTAKYLLTGLIRCWCGSAMHGGQFGRGKRAAYRCSGSSSKAAHKGGFVHATVAEGAVMNWLEALAGEIDAKTALKTAQKPAKNPSNAEKNRLLKANRQDIARLDTLTLKMLDGTVDSDTYGRIRKSLEEAINTREGRLRALESAERHPVTAIVPDLLSQWSALPLEVRQDLLSRLIGEVTVHPAGTAPRVAVRPLWASQEAG